MGSNKPRNEFREFLTREFLTNVVLPTLTIGGIGVVISKLVPGLSEDVQTLLTGVVTTFLLILYFGYRHGKAFLVDKEIQHYLEENLGIVKAYPCLESAGPDMQEDMEKSTISALLLQIGRKELGATTESFFYEILRDSEQPGRKVRILHASLDSPFLSRQRAQYRGSPEKFGEWQAGVKNVREHIKVLQELGRCKIVSREHKEPFLWRIFIFDDVVYVSAYIHPRKNDALATVYKIKKGKPNSLYSVFCKYFEYLWRKYDPESTMISEEDKWKDWT